MRAIFFLYLKLGAKLPLGSYLARVEAMLYCDLWVFDPTILVITCTRTISTGIGISSGGGGVSIIRTIVIMATIGVRRGVANSRVRAAKCIQDSFAVGIGPATAGVGLGGFVISTIASTGIGAGISITKVPAESANQGAATSSW